MVQVILTIKNGANSSKEFSNMAQALAYAYANGGYYAASKIEFINTEYITSAKNEKPKLGKPKEDPAAPAASAPANEQQNPEAAAEEKKDCDSTAPAASAPAK